MLSARSSRLPRAGLRRCGGHRTATRGV